MSYFCYQFLENGDNSAWEMKLTLTVTLFSGQEGAGELFCLLVLQCCEIIVLGHLSPPMLHWVC